MCCESFKKIVGAVLEIFKRALNVDRKFAKNYIGSDRMKKSNSRDSDNENQQNFHGDER